MLILLTMREVLRSVILLAALALCSCNAVSSLVHDDQVVARVGKEKLYKSELERFIPDMISAEDSARIAARYINSWAMDRLYMKVAEEQLSKAEIDVSGELEAYRLSLVKYRYEQRYINDRLDTLITDDQIREYYHAHEDDFKLARPVLKVRFVDVMKDSPNKDAILKMMASEEYDDIQRADTLAKSTALRYFDNSETWMDARDLAKAFGVEWQEMMSRMKDRMIKIEPSDRGDLLAAYVCDIRKDGPAPVEFCAPAIRDIIMSNRKHELLKALEQDLLDNALESKQFVIY